MRILVTNDDGIFAPGIAAMASRLRDEGHEVVVVAPLDDRSGTGAGVGPVHLSGGTAYELVDTDSMSGIPAYGIDGLPALAVMLTFLGAFGSGEAPDVVVSGINLGYNAGRAVLHSGTVGAALTAANFGSRALAVSLQATDDPDWEMAAGIAFGCLPVLAGAPAKTVVSLNVPGERTEPAGLRPARLHSSGSITAQVVETHDLKLEIRYGKPVQPPEEGTDVALLAEGYATVTALTGVGEDRGTAAATALRSMSASWRGGGREGLAS